MWWYIEDGEKKGPVAKEQIQDLLEKKELSLETLAWCEGMQNWEPLHELGFVLVEPEVVDLFCSVSPWRRFWARFLDMVLIGALVQALVGYLLWIPVEAFLLSSWGFTPGKWALNVFVRDKRGAKLCFDQALRRSFLVWLKGIWLGLPIVWMIGVYRSYRKVKNSGKTLWDQECETHVESKALPRGKAFVKLCIVLVLLSLLMIYGPVGSSINEALQNIQAQ